MNTKYMNPYLAGFLLGLVLLATIFITGRGLGASGALKSVVAASVMVAAPAHADSGPFYKSARPEGKHPMTEWLVFEVAGMIAGAFLSWHDVEPASVLARAARARSRPAARA